MKKLIATLITLVVLSMTALPLAAQTRNRYSSRATANTRSYDRYNSGYNRDGRYRTQVYQNDVNTNDVYNPYNNNRSVWDEHRDKITTAGGAVGGALLGALVGGKKGALIGAITGGAGAAVYTYKIRDKNRRF
jgi:uncharacterized protein YcfJ